MKAGESRHTDFCAFREIVNGVQAGQPQTNLFALRRVAVRRASSQPRDRGIYSDFSFLLLLESCNIVRVFGISGIER